MKPTSLSAFIKSISNGAMSRRAQSTITILTYAMVLLLQFPSEVPFPPWLIFIEHFFIVVIALIGTIVALGWWLE